MAAKKRIFLDDMTWLRPWICLVCLGVAIFISLPTISAILLSLTSAANAQSIATVLSAMIGFGGVILTTRSGFKNLIASQEAQAKRERDDRDHKTKLQQESKIEALKHDKAVLVASLQAELSMLLDQVHGQRNIIFTQTAMMRTAKDSPYLRDQESEIILPIYKTPIYDAHIDKLGLLGFSLASDVIKVYSGTKMTSNNTKFKPEQQLVLYEAFNSFYGNWSGEIVHVVTRLNSALGYCDDPGNLYQFRNERDAAINNKDAGRNV
ncbi:hypothetical protein [Brucella pituitosa]|uniref:hypothetical protein n=1 Tax=Brucella pituitosa TaxID=571256 RepID=UPI003F4AE109